MRMKVEAPPQSFAKNRVGAGAGSQSTGPLTAIYLCGVSWWSSLDFPRFESCRLHRAPDSTDDARMGHDTMTAQNTIHQFPVIVSGDHRYWEHSGSLVHSFGVQRPIWKDVLGLQGSKVPPKPLDNTNLRIWTGGRNSDDGYCTWRWIDLWSAKGDGPLVIQTI
jgi:hypothetical protein